MKRLLFNLLTALSVLVWLHAVLAAVFEAKGYNDGYVFARTLDAPHMPSTSTVASPFNPPPTVTFKFAGFKTMQTTDVYGHPVWAFFVPHWLGVITFAIIPALWLRDTLSRHQRRKRAGLNQCLNCAYDLRATPGQCPECGRMPAR